MLPSTSPGPSTSSLAHRHRNGAQTPVVETSRAVRSTDSTGAKFLNQYEVHHEIGKGTHGKVRLGIDTTTKEQVAIKVVERRSKKERSLGKNLTPAHATDEKILREIAIMKKCDHDHVVRLREVIDDPAKDTIFLVLEYMEHGDVKWRTGVQNEQGHYRPSLSVEDARWVFRDAVLGLDYLHHQGVIHRDIKPANLLVDQHGVIKISDFGVSHLSHALRLSAGQKTNLSLAEFKEQALHDEHALAKTAGSPAFYAPELCAQGNELTSIVLGETASTSSPSPRLPITKAIDVWALGVTLYCLLFGRTPFNAPNQYALFQIIPTEDYVVPSTMGSERIPIDSQEGLEAQDLLSRLMEKDPYKRITLPEVKHHPWVQRGLDNPDAWVHDTDPIKAVAVHVTPADASEAITPKTKIRRIARGLTMMGNTFKKAFTPSRTTHIAPLTAVNDVPRIHSPTPRCPATSPPTPHPRPPSIRAYTGPLTSPDIRSRSSPPLDTRQPFTRRIDVTIASPTPKAWMQPPSPRATSPRALTQLRQSLSDSPTSPVPRRSAEPNSRPVIAPRGTKPRSSSASLLAPPHSFPQSFRRAQSPANSLASSSVGYPEDVFVNDDAPSTLRRPAGSGSGWKHKLAWVHRKRGGADGSESGLEDYPSQPDLQPTSAGSSQGGPFSPWGRASGSQETAEDADVEETWDEPFTPSTSYGGGQKVIEDDDEYDFFSDDESSLGGDSHRSIMSAAAISAKSPPRSRSRVGEESGSRETGWIRSPYSPTAQRRGVRYDYYETVDDDEDQDVGAVDLEKLHIDPPKRLRSLSPNARQKPVFGTDDEDGSCSDGEGELSGASEQGGIVLRPKQRPSV